MPEHFDGDEHDQVQFAAGTDTPPPVRPFRRAPLFSFTIRRFDLAVAGFDEPTGHEHRMDPPVNLELFYGVDDGDLSITTFSTNDGNSIGHADIDDDNDSIDNPDDDDEFAPDATDDDEIDDEDDDDDDDDDDDGDGAIALEDEFLNCRSWHEINNTGGRDW